VDGFVERGAERGEGEGEEGEELREHLCGG
jgi:hypothetical protein